MIRKWWIGTFASPTELVKWAIAHGRAKAVDYDLWIARVTTDPAKDWWVAYLLGGATTGDVTTNGT